MADCTDLRFGAMDTSPDADQPTSPRSRKPGTDPLEARPTGIRVCEPRIALSASVAADLLLSAFDSPTDEPTGEPTDHSWLLDQARQVREQYGVAGGGQTIAVIDSGIAWDHVALGGGFGPGYRVVGGWDFAENDSDPYDDGPAGFHGSHVSGLVAGRSDGFAGMAPEADLVALRVFDDSGVGTLDAIESALQWVHKNREGFANPITTVNLSLGAILTDANAERVTAQLDDELQQLYGDGILVTAAGGNRFDAAFPDRLTYPANSPVVTAVGSLDADGSLSSFSQREPGILAAPGRGIVSTVPDHVLGWDGQIDDFVAANGTSMASPQIAGAAALVREAMLLADPDADVSPQVIVDHLRETAISHFDAVTGQDYYTVHLTNAINAILEGSDLGPPDETDGGSEAARDAFPEGFAIQNGRLEITGSDEADEIRLDLTDGLTIHMNGASYSLSANELTAMEQIEIDAAGGNDSLQIVGSSRAERLTLHAPGGEASNELISGEQTIQIFAVENLRFAGGGGSDRATLFDSTHPDRLEARPVGATLSGVGYSFEIEQAPRIYVHATAGGEDTAFLHDSAGDDALAVRPQFTSLRGNEHFNLAYGFERVYAYATAGGDDTATLYDSAGDDRMTASAASAFISGPGYYASARHFESVQANATAGGNDRATLYADDQLSSWHRTEDLVQLNLPQNDSSPMPRARMARGFERVETFVAGEPLVVTPLGWENVAADAHDAPHVARDDVRSLRSAVLDQVAGDFPTFARKLGGSAASSDGFFCGERHDGRSESDVLAAIFAELDDRSW